MKLKNLTILGALPFVAFGVMLGVILLVLSGCDFLSEDRPDDISQHVSFTWQARDPGLTNCDAGCFVTFVASTPGGSSFQWDFGDSGTSSQKDPLHRYDAVGQWIVRLEACPEGRTFGDSDCGIDDQVVETP